MPKLLTLILCLLLQSPAAHADGRTLDLSGPVNDTEVGRHVDMLLDGDHSLTLQDILTTRSDAFKPIATKVADAGYTPAMVWLRLRLTNRADRISDWRLYFHENFKQIFHVYVIDAGGSVDHALAQAIDSPFSTRPVDFPEVVVPFKAAFGEEVTVFVQYWTEGSTNLPLSIETVDGFTAISARKSAKDFSFYGMMLVLIVAALLAGIVVRHPVFPAYVCYAGTTLLYIMHSDGVAFQYLWPNLPLFNSYASVVTGGAFIVSGAHFARTFLNTSRHHPVLDKILLGFIALALLMIGAGTVTETSLIKKTLILVALAAITLFVVTGLAAARKRFKQVRFYVFAWLGAALSALMMTLRHWLGVEISQEFQYDSMRIVMIVDAAMVGMAIIDGYNQLRAERQDALRTSLEHAERSLEMSTRLRELQSQYELAVQSSARRGRQMENTIHDLRQPLHALRLAVHDAISDKPRRKRSYGKINESFSYLETLVSDHLTSALASEGKDWRITDDIDLAAMSLDAVLHGVHEMFLPDAEAKGLSFVYVPTSAHVEADTLAVMRIVTNLVSNAIKYTAKGKVLLGVRRLADGVRIEVHDTGPGLDAAAFALACQHGVRLDLEPGLHDGHGQGLAIVTELSKRYGYEIGIREKRTTGTGIGVVIRST